MAIQSDMYALKVWSDDHISSVTEPYEVQVHGAVEKKAPNFSARGWIYTGQVEPFKYLDVLIKNNVYILVGAYRRSLQLSQKDSGSFLQAVLHRLFS